MERSSQWTRGADQRARGGTNGDATAMAIRRPCTEKTVDGIAVVRLSSCASTWRSIGSSRSSWAWWRGEEGPVAMVNDDGGDELHSMGERGSQRRGEKAWERVRGLGGCVAPSGESSGEQASMRWLAPARVGHTPSCLLAGG